MSEYHIADADAGTPGYDEGAASASLRVFSYRKIWIDFSQSDDAAAMKVTKNCYNAR